MYRWQTLTLARVELGATLTPCSNRFFDAIKGILLRIGLHHFPEPDVNWEPRSGDDPPALWLCWEVDGRTLAIRVADQHPAPAAVSYRLTAPDGEDAGPLDDLAGPGSIVRSIVHRLLTGYDWPRQAAPTAVTSQDAPPMPAGLRKEEEARRMERAIAAH